MFNHLYRCCSRQGWQLSLVSRLAATQSKHNNLDPEQWNSILRACGTLIALCRLAPEPGVAPEPSPRSEIQVG
jgi:hypothetical protein